jgi:lysophospholipase L1-like esterase
MFKSSKILAALVLSSTLAWAAKPQQANLSQVIALGDSLSAGYQNFSLFDGNGAPAPAGQQHGFANLIAGQAGVDLHLPLISYPGIPPTLEIGPSGTVTRAAGIGLRENPGVQTLNLSVPGYLLADALGRVINPLNATNPIDAMALSVLAEPGTCGIAPNNNGTLTVSAVDCALQMHPTTILVSIGNNDALQGLIFGAVPTSSATFAAEYDSLLNKLSSTGASIAVGNIPDVTALPFLVPVSAFISRCGVAPAGAGPNDYVVPNMLNTAATSFDICSNYQPRSAALISQVSDAVVAFNKTIKTEAQRYNAVVVDVNKLFSTIAKKGYDVNGVHLTTGFLGGIFSLDGIHPTNTGYGIIANAYIDALNKDLGTALAPVDLGQIASQDPLIFAQPSH